MIPVIDLKSDTALKEIEEAYTSIGFAIFTNHDFAKFREKINTKEKKNSKMRKNSKVYTRSFS